MNFIHKQKMRNPSFEERNVTTDFVINQVKEQGQWLVVENKPSDVQAYWDRRVGKKVATSRKKRPAPESNQGGKFLFIFPVPCTHYYGRSAQEEEAEEDEQVNLDK